MARTSGGTGGGGGGLPAWFQSGDGDPITANPTVPNTVGGLYFDTSGNSGLWVAMGGTSADWFQWGGPFTGNSPGMGFMPLETCAHLIGHASGTEGAVQLYGGDGSEVYIGTGQVSVAPNGAPADAGFDSDGSFNVPGVFFPFAAPTVSAPACVISGMYFDTTLNKLRIGGPLGWETVTSV
jgi:hypothetical protein